MYNQALEAAPDGGQIERHILAPLRELAAHQAIAGSDGLIRWLEERQQEAGAGPPDQREAGEP